MKKLEELKVKLIKDKPKKVYAANIEFDYHLDDFISFLEGVKDKKFDIILNGKLFKITSLVAKNKFAEGFKASFSILIGNVTEAYKNFTADMAKLTLENNKLKAEANQVTKSKELYQAKEMAMTVRVASWEDRIAELEDTCKTLRDIINESNGKDNL